MILLICCSVAFGACILGTICGMGGGIIIKPALDALGVMTVATATFLSGCTVTSMSLWSVGKSIVKKETILDMSITPFLSAGAAAGGVAGKQLFTVVASLFQNKDMAGGVQACLLLAATAATFLYTWNKDRVTSRQLRSRAACVAIGLMLGMLGAFLGIGGGPFNVAILCFCFSMPMKKATQNSLMIVLFSQLASLIRTIAGDGIPQISWPVLLGMVVFAVAGSETGRRINQKIDNRQATLCLEGAMIFIMCINIYNICIFL